MSGAKAAFDTQSAAVWQETYFEARLTGRLQAAIDLKLHSRKRIMAFTRAENERRGRPMRWGDGYLAQLGDDGRQVARVPQPVELGADRVPPQHLFGAEFAAARFQFC